MIPGIIPVIIRKIPAPPSGYSFTMTAGDFSGVVQGYSSGSFPELPIPVGAINHEPIDGQNLSAFLSGVASVMAFDGDLASTLSGLVVWVDGTPYPFDGSDWTYQEGFTSGIWNIARPVFVNEGVYFVEIK